MGLAVILGILLGVLARYLNLLTAGPPCLFRNLCALMLLQMGLIWSNSSDAYMFWALLALFITVRAAAFPVGAGKMIFDERRQMCPGK